MEEDAPPLLLASVSLNLAPSWGSLSTADSVGPLSSESPHCQIGVPFSLPHLRSSTGGFADPWTRREMLQSAGPTAGGVTCTAMALAVGSRARGA